MERVVCNLHVAHKVRLMIMIKRFVPFSLIIRIEVRNNFHETRGGEGRAELPPCLLYSRVLAVRNSPTDGRRCNRSS